MPRKRPGYAYTVNTDVDSDGNPVGPLVKYTIEYRPETKRQGGPYEVKRGESHVRLCETASAAYRLVKWDTDGAHFMIEWINIPEHIRKAAHIVREEN